MSFTKEQLIVELDQLTKKLGMESKHELALRIVIPLFIACVVVDEEDLLITHLQRFGQEMKRRMINEVEERAKLN